MRTKFIDPPEGWRYGFPRAIPEYVNTMEWLVANGYPEARIKELGEHFYCRYWYEGEEDGE